MTLKVVQKPEEPVEREVLADAITKVSEGMTRLLVSGLNRKAIVVLLHDWSGVGKRDIEMILSGLACLKKDYCE